MRSFTASRITRINIWNTNSNPSDTPKEERERWEVEWRDFGKRYRKARNLASLHLSQDAVAVLNTYELEKARAKNENPYEWMEADLAASTTCLDALIVAAKNDLGVK